MKLNTTRRAFLGSAAVAAALPAGLPGAVTERPGDLKLGVASYSFRKKSRAELIEGLKALKVRYVNLKDMHLPFDSTPEQIAQARKEFADAGIQIVGGGTFNLQKDDEAFIRKQFEYAKAAGMPLMVCAPTHETLPKLEKYVKEYNIKVAVHNHGPEDKHFPTPQSVLSAVKNMDPRCGLCMDIGHTSRTGADIVESIREAGPRLLDMHAKDLSDPKAKESQVPVGDGVLPIVAIFKQLRKMGYSGYVNLEYEIDADNPLPGMQKSFAYMRGVQAGLDG